MSIISAPTVERLYELFAYDPATGVLATRIVRRGSGAKIGSAVGTVSKRGYLVVTLNRRVRYVHQIVWACMTGAWPKGGIDHRDGNPLNNRWDNLRLANQTQNNANARRRHTNSSGFKGVTWHRHAQKWCAQTSFKGKRIYIGLYECAEDAHSAYLRKAKELFGEFARAA